MFAFFVLAVLALLFVVAPARRRQTRRNGQKYREQAEANSRAWYEERLKAVEQDVLEEEDKTQLADELAAVLLLVAIISAITLAHRQLKRSRHQDIREQILTPRNERVRLVNMKSENNK